MAKYKVRYKVGPRYGGGYWQVQEFDSRRDAERFCEEKCREGRDAEIVAAQAERHETTIDTGKTVERYADRLFSRGSDLHLF